MAFRITGLPADRFAHLWGLDDAALAARGARRVVATASPGFPDRIGMRDAAVGETLILVNHEHQPADTPYRASHAVYVAEGAAETYDRVDEVPEVLRIRLLSLRAFGADGMMRDADVVDGRDLEGAFARMLADPDTAYVHVHIAKPGCYACRVDRA